MVSIVDNLLFLHRKRFLSQATPCVPHCETQNHFCHTDYQLHKSCDSQTCDTHSSVQTLIDFTRTLLKFRFVIASMRSMVFKCLDNFLCFSLSSRTNHYENTQCYFSVGLPRTVCAFVSLTLDNILQQYVPRNTVAK